MPVSLRWRTPKMTPKMMFFWLMFFQDKVRFIRVNHSRSVLLQKQLDERLTISQCFTADPESFQVFISFIWRVLSSFSFRIFFISFLSVFFWFFFDSTRELDRVWVFFIDCWANSIHWNLQQFSFFKFCPVHLEWSSWDFNALHSLFWWTQNTAKNSTEYRLKAR